MKSIILFNGITVLVGQNAQDNFNIIDLSQETDLWFHVGCSGTSCHVIAKMIPDMDKKTIRDTIKQSAIVCKHHSKCFNRNRIIEIIYTPIKNVTKTNKIGEVSVSNYKLINV